MAMIRRNVEEIEARIAEICRRIGKDPKSVTLVGVTKYADIDKIKKVVGAGITHLGENKVQEAQKKFQNLPQVTRHMIGHLQTNKVKAALEIFNMIQSLDQMSLADEIEKQAARLKRTVDVLVQVNASGEQQKFGIPPEDTLKFLEKAGNLEHLKIRGLMTIAPFTEDEGQIRGAFKKLKKRFDEAAVRFKDHRRITMEFLSMGMTNDFEIALEEGANMVRIGRALFKE